MDAFGVVVVLALIGVAIWYYGFTESGKKAMKDAEVKKAAKQKKELDRRPGNTVHQAISDVGVRSDGAGLACPKCGGTNFKAKRSAVAKAVAIPTLGVGALAVPKRRVKCITCGTEYLRK